MEENKTATPSVDETTPAEENTPNPPKEGDKQEQNPPSADEPKEGEVQSKEENAKFAKLRHERDIAKAKAAGDAEGYKRARIKSIGGKNPYTDTPIETDEDFEFYELQDEVKANGGDPNKPYEVEQLRRQKVEQAKKEAEDNRSEQEKNDAKASQEVKDYLADGHTAQELKEHWENPKFMEFAGDLLGAVPLKTIIAKFDKAYPKKESAKKEAANKISTPGSATNLEDPAPKKGISDMTKDEFKKYMDEVERGKRRIE